MLMKLIMVSEESKFKVGLPVFELSYILSIIDEELTVKFLELQQRVRNILQDDTGIHFYPKDFYVTLFSYVTEFNPIDEGQKNRYRAKSATLFSMIMENNLFAELKINFCSGYTTPTAVIITGDNFDGLERLRNSFISLGRDGKLLTEEKTSRYSQKIAEHGKIYPSPDSTSAHLVQLRAPLSPEKREAVDDFLLNVKFPENETYFRIIGLYELVRSGILSGSTKIDNYIFPRRWTRITVP